jgi:hypothetical protein
LTGFIVLLVVSIIGPSNAEATGRCSFSDSPDIYPPCGATRLADLLITLPLTVDSWLGGVVVGVGNSVAAARGKRAGGWLVPGYIFATTNIALGSYWLISTAVIAARYPWYSYSHAFDVGIGVVAVALGAWDLAATIMNHKGMKPLPVTLSPWLRASEGSGAGVVAAGSF